MKTMKDYLYWYIKSDVLLLTSVFEKFRNKSLKNRGSCPSHFLSAPGLKLELELIPDSAMYIFFEKGTRGGIYFIFNRYSKANNKYLKSYDPKKIELCYILGRR